MIWILVIMWFVISNRYFGWNWTPQSADELVCDGIGFVLIALAANKGI